MFPALIVLALLIIAAPILVTFDGTIIHGIVTAAAAVSIAIVALRIRPGEARFLSSIIYTTAVIAALPALWMLIQILPLKAVGLAHPIWESAASALGRPLAGSISTDPGATLITLARYLSMTAIAFVTTAVAVDRRRAEWLLFALTASTTLIALLSLTSGLSEFILMSSDSAARKAAIEIAGLGAIVAAAAALHTFELRKMGGVGQSGLDVRFWVAIVWCLIAAGTCSLAIILDRTSQAYFAVTCGIATLIAAVMIRRFHLGPWGYSAILSMASVAVIAAITLQPASQTLGLTLAFATRTPASLIASTQHVLAETAWTGNGAGTFNAALSIYGDIDELASSSIAPTAAASIAIGMGRPFLWAILIATAALVIMLLRGAVKRGRDSAYSIAGASCVVTVALFAFSNAALFSTSVAVIAAAVIGMAIAQSKSRSI